MEGDGLKGEVLFDDYYTLVCPSCGGEYLHHGDVRTHERNEDAPTAIKTTISNGHLHREPSSSDTGPSLRRHSLVIGFDCETCDNGPFALVIQQHKGQTTMLWRRSQGRQSGDVQGSLHDSNLE